MRLHRIIRFNELIQRVPLSRSTFWRLEREGKFPARKRLGPNAVGWLEADIDQWISEKNPLVAEKKLPLSLKADKPTSRKKV